MKKFLALLSCAVLMAATAVGCGSQNEKITVVSREDGSGTRSAFSELMGVVKDELLDEKKNFGDERHHQLHPLSFVLLSVNHSAILPNNSAILS